MVHVFGPGSQVVRHFSAKEIYAGVIPARASTDFISSLREEKQRDVDFDVHDRVFRRVLKKMQNFMELNFQDGDILAIFQFLASDFRAPVPMKKAMSSWISPGLLGPTRNRSTFLTIYPVSSSSSLWIAFSSVSFFLSLRPMQSSITYFLSGIR